MAILRLVDPSATKKAFDLARSSGTVMDLTMLECLTGDPLDQSEMEQHLEMSNTGHPTFASVLKSTDILAAFNRLKALSDEPAPETEGGPASPPSHGLQRFERLVRYSPRSCKPAPRRRPATFADLASSLGRKIAAWSW